MEQPRPAAADCETPEVAIVDALQMVIAQVDAFLSTWLDRIEHVAVATDASPVAEISDERLRRRIEQFQLEQQCWETQRDAEEKQIAEQCEQLTAAWLRLEAERRELLEAKAAHHDRPPISHVSMGNVAVGVKSPLEPRPDAFGQPASVPSSALNTNQTQESAIRQFNLLRQQIQLNRPISSQR